MKGILLISLVVLSGSLISQNQSLVFPAFDEALLQIWKFEKGRGNLPAGLKQIENEWDSVRKELKERKLQHINIDDFILLIDEEVVSLRFFNDMYMKDFASMISYNILLDFKTLREHSDPIQYSLDRLLDTYNLFHEIEGTVNDQMFGLLEWFEFEDLMCGLKTHIEEYNEISINEIQKHFPSINNAEHFQSKQRVLECFSELQRSLNTGFIPDFKIPCNDLKQSLEELFNLYKNSEEL